MANPFWEFYDNYKTQISESDFEDFKEAWRQFISNLKVRPQPVTSENLKAWLTEERILSDGEPPITISTAICEAIKRIFTSTEEAKIYNLGETPLGQWVPQERDNFARLILAKEMARELCPANDVLEMLLSATPREAQEEVSFRRPPIVRLSSPPDSDADDPDADDEAESEDNSPPRRGPSSGPGMGG